MTNPSIGMLAVGTHGSATAQVGQALRYPFRYAGTLGAWGTWAVLWHSMVVARRVNYILYVYPLVN